MKKRGKMIELQIFELGSTIGCKARLLCNYPLFLSVFPFLSVSKSLENLRR